jgi:hypothetical protein
VALALSVAGAALRAAQATPPTELDRPAQLTPTGPAALSQAGPVGAASAVARSTVFLTSRQAQGRAGCSASLIDESHALTAWHCHIGGPLPDDAVVVFAPQYGPDAPTRPAVEFLAPDGPEHADIAVVRFTGGLPPGYAPVPLAGATRVSTGTAVIHAGYGQTGRDTRDRGTLRAAVSRFDRPLPGLRYRAATPGHGLCSGDSGGPDLVAVGGELRQLGVHVTGDCHGFGISTDVRHQIDWIRSTGARPAVDTGPVEADREIALPLVAAGPAADRDR